jgi:hypothetical protein
MTATALKVCRDSRLAAMEAEWYHTVSTLRFAGGG